MAGRHEHPRGEGSRTDGVTNAGGEYVDSDIPGEDRVARDEPSGEFVSSDIPGEATPTAPSTEGSYEESDIPGENDEHDTGEAIGSFTDSEIPGETPEK